MSKNKIFLPYIFLTNSITLINYKKFFFTQLFNILQFYLPKIKIYRSIKIKILFNLLYFYFNKIDETIIIDKIQKIKPYLQINLPIKIINLKNTIIKIINIGKLPILNINSNLIINGFQKYFISKVKKKSGIYFFKFYKGNTIIYSAHLILSKFEKFQIEINELGYAKIFFNYDFNINFFFFLNFLGLQNKDILYFSKYGNNYILKKNLIITLLQYSYFKNTIIINKLKFFKSYLFLLNINFNLFYFKYLKFIFFSIYFNRNQIENLFSNYFIDKLYFLSIELLQIYDFLLDLSFKKLSYNILDHFGNKKLENIANFYNNQFNLIFFRLLKKKFNKIILYKLKTNLTKNFISLKEQLTINPLLQFADQINLLSETIHKYKVTYINQNSLNNTLNNINLREVYPTQLGKICMIDTVEGKKSGLNITLSINTVLNKRDILKAPFYIENKFNKKNPIILESFEQEKYQINLTGYILKKNLNFNNYTSIIIYKGEFKNKFILTKNIIYLKLLDLLSLGEIMIPFLIYNDPIRCIMGSKMLNQSIPSIYKNKPYILTGYEIFISNSTFKSIKSIQEGIVIYVSTYKIIVRDLFNREISYFLSKYKYSNQGLIINLKPVVWVGERILSGQYLAINLDLLDNEFNIGNNISIIYGSFFGFEFEDSIIINKDIIYNNIFTSLHIDTYETILNNSLIKLDYSTLKLPKYNKYVLRNLDKLGIIKEGSKILINDILISKIKLKNNILSTIISIKNFLFSLLGKNIRTIQDNSTIITSGQEGRVIKIEILKKKTNLILNLFISKLHLLQYGDKICGRHGNKGVISLITESCNLPYSLDGFYPELIVGPLGIPSRMNLGQLYESLLGLSGFILDCRFLIKPEIDLFLGGNYTKAYIYQTLKKTLEKNKIDSLYNPYILGKYNLKNGFSGVNLKGPILIGNCYYSKLIHISKKKIHSRLIGPYSELTQQPLKGRSKQGGQRFGEMEVWALEAFGAAYNLREILGYKSDSFQGRYNLNKYLITNKFLKLPTLPESFKLTIRELNGLALNIDSFILSNYLYGQKIPLNLIF